MGIELEKVPMSRLLVQRLQILLLLAAVLLLISFTPWGAGWRKMSSTVNRSLLRPTASFWQAMR